MGKLMFNLCEYLSQSDSSKLFPKGEFTNPVRFIYTALMSAACDNADTLVITSNGFRWYKQDELVDAYLGQNWVKPIPSFNVLIHRILEHDSVLQNHLILVLETHDETKINIVY